MPESEVGYLFFFPKDAYYIGGKVMASLYDNTTQVQNGNNSTAHMKYYNLFMGQMTDLSAGASLMPPSTILKFHFTNLPTDLGDLSSITWESSIGNAFRVKGGFVSDEYEEEQVASLTLGLTNISVNTTNREVTAYMSIYTGSAKSTRPKLSAGSTIRAIVTGTNGKS